MGRSREWMQATMLFAVIAPVGLVMTGWLALSRPLEDNTSMIISVIVGAASAWGGAVVAWRLWRRDARALRQGVAMCVFWLGGLGALAYIAHSYLAVALLMLPIYLLVLLTRGRERWRGFEEGNPGRRRSPLAR